jgi:hypothetical protein
MQEATNEQIYTADLKRKLVGSRKKMSKKKESFSGNIVQMIVTACIGAIFCFCRLKVKNCSTLSLAIGHGIYDALITVWACTL